MIAYNTTALDNKDVLEQSGRALKRKLISKEEFDIVSAAHPVNMYSPNLFIRIGLFLATAVIVSMSFGLFALFLGGMLDSDGVVAVMFGIFGIGVYAGLEFMIQKMRHYRSGVDDALMWISVSMLAGDLVFYFGMSELIGSVTIFLFALVAAIRFANSVMSAVAFLSFLAVLFFAVTPFGAVAKITLPFLTFAVSTVVYFIARSKRNNGAWRHYRYCILMIEFLSLIAAYASVNYFIVRELSVAMFDLPENTTITGSWFFWTATFLIPVIYIWRGLNTKDALILRTGLLLSAAAVFTFRAYFSLAPVEQVMTGAGIVLIFATYLIIKYLRKPRKGIIDELPDNTVSEDDLHLEALVVTETFKPETIAEQGFDFGGGSTGGGGASGRY